MSNDDHTIRIRLDISIPNNGKPIQVETAQPLAVPDTSAARASAATQQTAEHPHPAKPTFLGVICPRVSQPHPVKPTGSGGTTGVIYAEGNCVGIEPTPDEVILQCNSGNAIAAILDASGNWAYEDVPGAICSSDSGSLPYNVLHVQYKYHGSLIRQDDVPFYGECNGSGGCDDDRIATANRFLPTNYQVSIKGFSQALSHFNGQWALRVAPSGLDDAEICWKSDLPNGKGSIELIGRPACQSAQLVFRDGVHEVRYEKPKGSWHAMNVADFANCHCVVVPPGAAVPAIVQVELA